MNKIREAKMQDIPLIVYIHQNAFKDFFLTQLGSAFLKLYYRTVNEYKGSVLLVCYNDDGQLYGFCAATYLSNGFNRRLVKKNFWLFVIMGLKLLLKNPNVLRRLVKNFTKSDSSFSDDGDYAELLSIGVDKATQGKGVGRLLLTSLESWLSEHGKTKISLTTDYYNNEKTLSFYKSSHYEIMYDFIAYPNRRMYRLIKKLSE